MPKYFCQSIDECVFGADGKCVYCPRKEPGFVRKIEDDELPREQPDDIADDEVIRPPRELF